MIDINQIESARYVYDLYSGEKYGIQVVCESQEFSVPLDPRNSGYKKLMDWVAEGNTIIDNPPEENNE